MVDQDETIRRYLDLLGIPEEERAFQKEKFLSYDIAILTSELASLEAIAEESAKELGSSSDLWFEEQAMRDNLENSQAEIVREWLDDALHKFAMNGSSECFAPIEDLVKPDSLFEDLFRYYLSLPPHARTQWQQAIVEICASELSVMRRDPFLAGLLELVSETKCLGLLAAKSEIAGDLLEANCEQYLDIPPLLLLDIFTTACRTENESWVPFIRWVCKDFGVALESGALTERDFRMRGEILAEDDSVDLELFKKVPLTPWLRIMIGATDQTHHSAPMGLTLPNMAGVDLLRKKCAMIEQAA